MRIAITGSNGFIGHQLVEYFLANGHEVVLLQRKAPQSLPASAFYQSYDLDKPEVLPGLEGVNALIHTAYMPFTATNHSSEKNVTGTWVLYQQCLSQSIHFVFLSSMSAHSNALSQYGRHKYELDKKLDSDKCLILKLGLVIGREGLFNRMYQSFKKMPFAVVAGGGRQPIQPVYIGDVVKVIAKCIALNTTGTYTLAFNRSYTMRQLFTAIAAKAGKRPLFISVPYWLVDLGIRAIETCHLPFPVSNENLLGLRQLQSTDTSVDLKKLGVTLLDLEESIKAV